MVIEQAEVWWADLEEPGSEPGYRRRPAVVAQCNAINRSKIATVVCVPLTSNLKWADAPGNVLLRGDDTGLPQDSVANVSLGDRVGQAGPHRPLAQDPPPPIRAHSVGH